jgi:RHS repeat-associated protein
MKTKLKLAILALITGTAFGSMPAALPEFKNEKQLAEWRAEMAAKPAPQTIATEDHAFYTGKPYVESSGGYAFKYRSYNPELARWTSEDPSGFPDGANGNIYAPTPTSAIDFAGLWEIQVLGNGNPAQTKTGTVDTAWYSDDETIKSSASLSVQSSSGSGSVQVNGTTIGRIYPFHSWTAVVQASFSVSVDNSGIITIAPTTGGWDCPDNDLQVAATYSVTDLGNNTKRLTFTGASIYQGTGLSGAGVAGASLSWTGGTGKVSSFVFVDFKAVE